MRYKQKLRRGGGYKVYLLSTEYRGPQLSPAQVEAHVPGVPEAASKPGINDVMTADHYNNTRWDCN